MSSRADIVSSFGYLPTYPEDGYVDLPEGGREAIEFGVTKGREYGFLAVCDDDCSDLDVIVYDKNGDEVVRDFDDDDYPAVYFTAEYSGNYTVETIMRKCSTSVCAARTRGFVEQK